MTDRWRDLEAWWRDEIATDPAYVEEVLPLLLDLLAPEPGLRYLEAGCGEGQAMRAVARTGAEVVGCDLAPGLLATARQAGPVVRCRLPELAWAGDGTCDGVFVVLVLEHLDDPAPLLAEAARVTRPGGTLVVVRNHPVVTAPGAGPFVDPGDGETLWRWGSYLHRGSTEEPAGEGTVTFHHQPLGELLGAAAATGWVLLRLEERGVGAAAARRDPLLAAQRHIPKLLGIRWRRD